MFGAGGGTSSYREVEEAEVIVLWGSNARDAHPIFFHHVLKAVRRGARLYVVDPRRTGSAEFADAWLPVRVGSDIALSHAIARVILERGLEHTAFIARATSGFEAFRAAVEPWTLPRAEAVTGVPAALIERVAVDYARARRAQLCWTLGITEHHNAVDNVLSLINLALLTGHVGRWGSGLNPLRGQNNVQGGGDMGALPNKLPGFQDVESEAARERVERVWGVSVPPKRGWHLTEMFHAMERRELRCLYVIGENPAQSEADSAHALDNLRGLDGMIVQDLFLTRTAAMADVVLPAAASFCESDGTVTNSERRVQRVRKAVDPPAGARDDLEIVHALGARLGVELGSTRPEDIWNELRSVSPMHRGMSYARLEALGGIQWPCPDEDSLEPSYLHGRLWQEPRGGPPAPFSPVVDEGPVEALSDEFPLRLTTGRRLDSYNTGVQSGGFDSPLRREETIDLHPDDAARLGLREGDRARVTSRRGSVEIAVRIDRGLQEGLVFMTFHAPDEVDTNALTIDATDPKSGTAEFKAAAVRVERATLTTDQAAE